MNNYDPYKILQVNYTDNLVTIRNAFKRLALIHHPDRGGNQHIFDLCTRAYRDIYTFKQQQQKQLHRENRTLSQVKKSRPQTYTEVKLNQSEQKDLEKNFNRIFDNVRIEKPSDIGYGHMMAKSSKSRDDKPSLSEKDRFSKRQLVVYEEPQPISTLKDNYEELGESKIKDFSKRHSGSAAQYTDYLVAHSDKDSIESMTNVRNTNYKSMDDLLQSRKGISYKMTSQDQQKYDMKIHREKEMEQKRQMLFYKHKEDVSKKFSQIHRYLTLG